MADPTEVEIQAIWKNIIKIFEEAKKFASGNVSNFVDLQATLVDSLKGDFTSEIENGIINSRNRVSALLLDAANAFELLLRTYGKFIDSPEVDGQSIITRLYDYWVTTGTKITSREFLIGSPTAAGGNTGNGEVLRLALDENGYSKENLHVESRVAECIADATSGTDRHEEVFEFRGQSASRDSLRLTGSSDRTTFTAISARASANGNFVKNPSFSNLSGTITAPTDIQDWDSDITVNGTNYEFVTGTEGVDYYRGFPADTTPYALRIKALAADLSQKFEENVSKFDAGTPYFVQIAWKRNTGADGTLTVTLGDKTESVSISSATVGVWNKLRIGLSSDNFYKQFNSGADLKFKITRSGGSTGSIDVDDVLLTPFQSFDGSWYVVVGGTQRFLREDKFTWSDTENAPSGKGVLQTWLWRSFGRYLQSAPAAPTTPVVAALAGAGAGNVTNGTHSYKVTFVTAHAGESGPTATSNVVNVTNNAVDGKVNLTGVPLGSAAVTSRKIYRTTTGDVTPYKLVGTIADNVTTTFQDNVADGSLGASAPTGATFLDP